MKVLIVFREDDTDNLFVPVLCEAIRKQGIDVHCSGRDFWEKDEPYDIIHFQWPEEAVGWNCTDISVIDRLRQRIRHFKDRLYKAQRLSALQCQSGHPAGIRAHRIVQRRSGAYGAIQQGGIWKGASRQPECHHPPPYLRKHLQRKHLTRRSPQALRASGR